MRIPVSVCAAAFAAVAFLSPTRAQIKVFGGQDSDRRASSVLAFEGENFAFKGAVCINYSQPTWKDAYDKEIDGGKFNGTNQRLGKNWWTSLDTTIALDIGGTKVNPGIHYLGINIDSKGKCSLAVLESKKALDNGWTPFQPDKWKVDTLVPLTMNKNALSESQTKMVIAIESDKADPSKGKFSIQWGKHELTAPVKFHFAGAKDAAAEK
jgi:hypothetical protein